MNTLYIVTSEPPPEGGLYGNLVNKKIAAKIWNNLWYYKVIHMG